MLVLSLIFVAIAISLLQRVREKRRTQAQEYPEHAKPSPLSDALQELIAMAGGVYLSLLLLVSFLQISLPEKIALYGMEMETLAFFALVLALMQPFILSILAQAKKGGR